MHISITEVTEEVVLNLPWLYEIQSVEREHGRLRIILRPQRNDGG
jgi:hypothetical protein